jgi:hypothetical protein
MVNGRDKNDNIKVIEIIIISSLFEYPLLIMENIPARGINKLIIVKKK